MPDDEVGVRAELAEVRRIAEVGFAENRGQLGLLLQRADQSDGRVRDLDQRVDRLERGRWPLPAVAALTGLGALILSAVALVRP
ncbi:hypothetical protein [Kitasatospora sp. HPMI-4]|uniref:hypothetical protein n=1 Tax=Kitasatospora sp. HPMI-4 TaxID=3448443 RepID=UPI003F197C75